MGWHFDRVLNSSNSNAATPTGTQPNLAVNGKLLWLVSPKDKKIMCFDIVRWHQNRTDDSSYVEEVPPVSYGPYLTVESPGFPCFIEACFDHAYISQSDLEFDSQTFDEILVVNSAGNVVNIINLPVSMRSNIVYDNGKLWMVSQLPNGNFQQSLYSYDLNARTFSSTPIPARHQDAVRSVARDHNGHILVADFNNLSITKFDNAGTYVSTTRIAGSTGTANREPNQFALDSSRNLFVSSYNGMISKMNTEDDTFTAFSTGLGDVTAFADDGVFQWVATKKRASTVNYDGKVYECKESHIARGNEPDPEKWNVLSDEEAMDGDWTAGVYYVDDKRDLLRINKSTQRLRHFSTEERDIQIEDDGPVSIVGKVINRILVTNSFTVATGVDTTITVPQYVWLVTEDCKIVGYPTTSMFRTNYYEMKGVAMMSLGQYDYTGD